MVEIFGKLYAWSDEALKEAVHQIINGAELTINYRMGIAFINDKNVKQNIPCDYAKLIVASGFVECDSGNTETSERHYLFIKQT